MYGPSIPDSLINGPEKGTRMDAGPTVRAAAAVLNTVRL